MLAGKMVLEVGALAVGEKVFLIALGAYAIGLVAGDRCRCFRLVAFQIPHTTIAPNLIAALACEVIELLADVP